MSSKLSLSFYQDADVVGISKALLGKRLYSCFDGELTAGIIVETEAYRGPEDRASHAYGNRRTARTETMFQAGGVAYVYLIYGIHQMFNVVTGPAETPHAVLIRGLEPVEGIDLMLQRRNRSKLDTKLTAGPGSLAKAMGFHKSQSGLSLIGNQIWIEPAPELPEAEIIASPRVGIDYAEEWVDKPWRFWIKNNPWVSKTR